MDQTLRSTAPPPTPAPAPAAAAPVAKPGVSIATFSMAPPLPQPPTPAPPTAPAPPAPAGSKSYLVPQQLPAAAIDAGPPASVFNSYWQHRLDRYAHGARAEDDGRREKGARRENGIGGRGVGRAQGRPGSTFSQAPALIPTRIHDLIRAPAGTTGNARDQRWMATRRRHCRPPRPEHARMLRTHDIGVFLYSLQGRKRDYKPAGFWRVVSYFCMISHWPDSFCEKA